MKVVNIGAEDILEGNPRLVLGLIWQLVKISLLSKVNPYTLTLTLTPSPSPSPSPTPSPSPSPSC